MEMIRRRVVTKFSRRVFLLLAYRFKSDLDMCVGVREIVEICYHTFVMIVASSFRICILISLTPSAWWMNDSTRPPTDSI